MPERETPRFRRNPTAAAGAGFELVQLQPPRANQSWQPVTPASWTLWAPCGHLAGMLSNGGPHNGWLWRGYGPDYRQAELRDTPLTQGQRRRTEAQAALIAALKERHPPGGCPTCSGEPKLAAPWNQGRLV